MASVNMPDISSLNLVDPDPGPIPQIPDDIACATDRYMQKLKNYAATLPYSIEPYSRMQDMLEFILLRMTQCIEAKDFSPGFFQWDSMLSYWGLLRYPIPKERRIQLIKLYYHVCTTPGMPSNIVTLCSGGLRNLTLSRKKLRLEDMRLPWKPLYDILSEDLFLHRRQFEYSQLSWDISCTVENVRRFFHPAAIDVMLETFLPLLNGTHLDSILSVQYYLLFFLPMSHPQSYLPMLFRMWESVNSYLYDDHMLEFLSYLAEMHVDPSVSDPRRIETIPDDEISEGESRPRWSRTEVPNDHVWTGIFKDVGVFTEDEWNMVMCKCLASMEIPLADLGSLSTGPSVDNQAGFEILNRLPKAQWRIASLASIIVYSMAPDGQPSPVSTAPTPYFTPLPSGMNTPRIRDVNVSEYLAIPLGKKGTSSPTRTYLGGCRALDSLAKLIASVESFFHPTNSGSWTAELSAFIKCIVVDFQNRWYAEQKPDCKTPTNRRLTSQIRSELVKSLRTVSFLAMFSEDSTVVSNIETTLRHLCLMEPELILHPILERAVPSLEALVETQRTIAVIRALRAVAPALVSRDLYYPGAKYLVPILQLLVPGIDLNDPLKTHYTAKFLIEVAQSIRFDDLTAMSSNGARLDHGLMAPSPISIPIPTFALQSDVGPNLVPRLSNSEEDALLIETTRDIADWVTSLLRRVIQLLENLPEESESGGGGGESEVQIVDLVGFACKEICLHLSEPLYELALNTIFDYASTNVRPNAVRVIHQLVHCVANADPVKSLAKFFNHCAQCIRVEIEHGASSLRTTSDKSPIPSDATLHWNLAILRAVVNTEGSALLTYRDELLSLFRLLQEKTLSKRGYTWSGQLLSKTLKALTCTYPLHCQFVNHEEWESEKFRQTHYLSWGRLYKHDEIAVDWHVPGQSEIDFALQILRESVETTLGLLENLLDNDRSRESIWRNDFCRYLNFVVNAFSGIPTLIREIITPEEARHALETSDIRDEIPEMIANIEPIAAGFCLTDPADPRYQYVAKLRRRFGECLHKASLVLRQQGEENTLYAVLMLVSAIRTYMLDYGDQGCTYEERDKLSSQVGAQRRYEGQQVWPREIFVARARLYHYSRLRWNSIERRRGSLEDTLIDDVVEWSIWHYPTVRESSQSLLEAMGTIHDGIRRRALPMLYKALQPGTDDDRMKGALWTLNSPSLAKYAMLEPLLAHELLENLFACQHNVKPSIQSCVSVVFDNCINGFPEPSNLMYSVDSTAMDSVAQALQASLKVESNISEVTSRCKAKRIERVRLNAEAFSMHTPALLTVATADQTHWKYKIFAIRILRTLVRRDGPLTSSHVEYFFEAARDDIWRMRYYAQRAIVKALRYVKMRTLCRNKFDLALGQSQNPLQEDVPINPSHAWTSEFLEAFREPFDLETHPNKPIFADSISQGWLVWKTTMKSYKPPARSTSTLQPWEEASQPVVDSIRNIVLNASFWEELSEYYAEENYNEVINHDNAAFVKSIFQLLDDEPFEALRPTLEMLIHGDEDRMQRAAAEFLAGVLTGSKHWPTNSQQALWLWLVPQIERIFTQNIRPDTLSIWTSFLEYVFYKKDPRRVGPLVDFLWEAFKTLNYNAESTFDAVKVLHLFRAFVARLGWKFSAWTDDALQQSWPEIRNDHDEVRAYVGELLAFSEKIKRRPRPSMPIAEVFVKECLALPYDYDIMGIRGTYHKSRVSELAKQFETWRDERIPGVRAFQSTYDRVGLMVCTWLLQAIHDVHAISTFDYILPLMPELFRFSEVSDHPALADVANTLMVRMCGVKPPKALVDPILDAMFAAIQMSPSWRIRLNALPLLQVFYFRQVPLINDDKIVEILEVLCKRLGDEIVEVREKAAETLSGILRLSTRRSILSLKDRFVRLVNASHIPPRQSPDYNIAVRQRHAAILGVCALVDSYPYTMERWMPELLTGVLAEHTYDPIPISTSVRKCAANFRKTHQDTWQEDMKKFDEGETAALSTLLTGSSYYA